MAGNAKKPSKVKTDKNDFKTTPEDQRQTGSAGLNPGVPTASPAPTSPDEVSDAARLGGSTVGELKG